MDMSDADPEATARREKVAALIATCEAATAGRDLTNPTQVDFLALADGYEALAELCRLKAEEYGEAVVAAILTGSTNREVDLHNARMEYRLYGDANTYQTYANSFQNLADGKEPGPLPPGPNAASAAGDPGDDAFRGYDYRQLGLVRMGLS